jgi:hypothetical protein
MESRCGSTLEGPSEFNGGPWLILLLPLRTKLLIDAGESHFDATTHLEKTEMLSHQEVPVAYSMIALVRKPSQLGQDPLQEFMCYLRHPEIVGF